MPADDELAVIPIHHPIDATVTVPGSKSLTNRALVCAALAAGESTINNVLEADDTAAMVDALRALGISVEQSASTGLAGPSLRVVGCAGRLSADVAFVDARLSGTTSRFVLPLAALSPGTTRVDGGLPLRARPMAPSIDALRALGVTVTDAGAPGHLPVDVSGGPAHGGEVAVAGDASSQFLSGLLLAGPAMAAGVTLQVTGELVSLPYVEMTAAVMEAFGARLATPTPHTWRVEPQGYQAITYEVEPDASTASYVFAAAAITGGSATVAGLGSRSLQGDIGFVDVLEQMGARVERSRFHTTVTGTGTLRGVQVDMGNISDTAQTLAAVAAFAEGPTQVTGIGFIRRKETDRIAAVVTELRRAGIHATEDDDGFTVVPGPIVPATVATYHDHRMAMAFALLGLRAEGIRIADPGCVAKTFPGYWQMLDDLRSGRLPPASSGTARVDPS